MPIRHIILALLLLLGAIPAYADDAPAKPKVAVFPLSGSATEKIRNQVGFSLRMKLNRDQTYEAIDGPTMDDFAGDAKINFDTTADEIKKLAADSGAVVIIWGQVDSGFGLWASIQLKILDLREKEPVAHELRKAVADPVDLRFAMEEVLKTIPGVKDFQHPSEEPVHHDEVSDAAFAKNPNLVVNGDFSKPGHWFGMYLADKWEVKNSDTPPGTNQVVINVGKAGNEDEPKTYLAMKLDKTCAENNGLACTSDAFRIKPDSKYRVTFLYRSAFPTTHVFVKGYTFGKDIAGKPKMSEIYRCQVPPGDATHGKWVLVECDFNPQHTVMPVVELKVDLYAYLHPGQVDFADVQVKEIGQQAAEDKLKDPALRPATQP